jgi:hypothetical protein
MSENRGYQRNNAGSSDKSYIKRQLAVRDMTESSRVSYLLRTSLLEYESSFGQSKANNIRETIVEMEGIENMNMKYLAGAIYLHDFITNAKEKLKAAHFDSSKNPMMKILQNITNSGKKSEENIVVDRIEDIFIYYIAYITFIATYSGKTQFDPNTEFDSNSKNRNDDDDEDEDEDEDDDEENYEEDDDDTALPLSEDEGDEEDHYYDDD